jgi:hypothetical protein
MPNLRPYQTLAEAAQLLSRMLRGTPVTEGDVLQAALAGQLKLSVFLPNDTVADCWNLDDDPPPRAVEHGGEQVDDHPPQDDDERTDAPTGIGIIDGVWDLPLVPPGTLQVENWCNELRGLPPIGFRDLQGAVVVQGRTVCRLRAEGQNYLSPPSRVPVGTKPVVRTTELLAFAATLGQADLLDKPLGEKETTKILTIVGACLSLAKKANPEVDRSQPFKAAKHIAAAAQQMGAEISENTVAKYLKLANEVLPIEET